MILFKNWTLYVFCLFYVCVFNSCTNNNVRGSKSAIMRINDMIDSVSHYYGMAKLELQNHKPIYIIVQTYRPKIISLHDAVSNIIDSVTNEYMQRKVSQSEYDVFIKSLNTEPIQKTTDSLKSLGVNFD